MLTIMKFPKVFEDAIKKFVHIFANEPEKRNCGQIFNGFIISAKKGDKWNK
jgi:hypothetical protein